MSQVYLEQVSWLKELSLVTDPLHSDGEETIPLRSSIGTFILWSIFILTMGALSFIGSTDPEALRVAILMVMFMAISYLLGIKTGYDFFAWREERRK